VTCHSPVQNPRARVIGTETNRNIIPCCSRRHDVPADRIVVVVGTATCTPYYIESMLIIMINLCKKRYQTRNYPPREDGKDAIIIFSADFMCIKQIAYWTTNCSPRYRYFNSTIARKSIDTPFGQQVLSRSRSTQNLKQDG